MSFWTSVRSFIQIGPYTAEKWRVFDFQDQDGGAVILDFRGTMWVLWKAQFRLPRSSIETIALNCLLFEKIAFCILATDGLTDRQTDRQMDRHIALSYFCCRERRLNNAKIELPSVILPGVRLQVGSNPKSFCESAPARGRRLTPSCACHLPDYLLRQGGGRRLCLSLALSLGLCLPIRARLLQNK